MSEVINCLLVFVCSIITLRILIYASTVMINIDEKSIKKYFLFIILSIIMTLSHLYVFNILKSFISLWLVILYIKIAYKQNLIKCIVVGVISMLILLISEIIYVTIIVVLLNIDRQFLYNNFSGTLLANASISIICYLLVTSKFISVNIKKIFSNADYELDTNSIVIISILFVTVSLMIYYVYFQTGFLYSLFSVVIIVIGTVSLIIYLFTKKCEWFKLQIEYNIISNSLSEYEEMYSHQKLIIHEYKNDLMIIRGMTNKNNKKLIKYIDEIVKFKNYENTEWLTNLKRIPEGGLLGILYYKLTLMQEKNVEIKFVIEDNFSPSQYLLVPDKIKYKICKILGIFLDNALNAVENLSKKEVSIVIGENNEEFIFNISNNFKGFINLLKINDAGYSTNGNGRGYGLAIAKEIIDSEEDIVNETNVTGEYFIQQIVIKK